MLAYAKIRFDLKDLLFIQARIYNSLLVNNWFVILALFFRTLSIRTGLALLWLISLLPYSVLMFCGRRLGGLMRLLISKRRKIAEINLTACFPDLDKAAIHKLVKQHFHALGMAFMEMGICWWWSDDRLRPLLHLDGFEHIENAHNEGKGVILLSAHFTDLEIGGRLLALKHKLHAVYRKHQTPYFEAFIKNRRALYTNGIIEKNNIRAMLKSLKNKQTVWYAPDQNFSGKNSILADFFGQPAPSNAATARLAKMTGAAVIPFVQFRREDGKGYNLKILPALENFPVGDDLVDANRINALFEQLIIQQPSHYYWVHRRFKNLPDQQADIYQLDKER